MTPMRANLFASIVFVRQRLRYVSPDQCEISVSADTFADTCDNSDGRQARTDGVSQ